MRWGLGTLLSLLVSVSWAHLPPPSDKHRLIEEDVLDAEDSSVESESSICQLEEGIFFDGLDYRFVLQEVGHA